MEEKFNNIQEQIVYTEQKIDELVTLIDLEKNNLSTEELKQQAEDTKQYFLSLKQMLREQNV
jgi:hypothetical protein